MRPDDRRLSRAEPRRWHDHPPHRARDARRDGARAPHLRAPPRRSHRARHAARSGAQPRGARVLSRRRDRGLMLAVRDLDLYYGDAQALDRVSLEVPEGEIVAIVGANAAGKSSLIRSIAGIETPRAGSIAFKRAPITRLESHRICNLGIGQVA